ncbi:MAG: ABC transporter permease subunit, partial [Alphaproteobacteria bacterium]|nr:ABC transporter permease subunit [Alphaproteobacteria bacterium]
MVGQIFLTELLKLRRTKITWVSLIAIAIMPMVGGLFTWIAKDPARAADLGLMGQKAQFIGVTADWPSFFLLILQTMGVAGMILVSVIAVYVFGREYTEQTAKNLLALPVGRHWFVIAKLGVVALWFAVLVGFLIAWSLVVGWLVGMPGFSLDLAVTASADLFLAASVGWLLVPAVA